MKIMPYAALLLCFSPCCAESADFRDSTIILNGHTANGKDINVTIENAKLRDDCDVGRTKMWGGSVDFPADSHIRNINISIAGDRVFVPMSSYNDLSAARTAKLISSGGGFKVQMSGADAGLSWNATIGVALDHVQERKVCSGEFPDYCEKTVYPPPISDR